MFSKVPAKKLEQRAEIRNYLTACFLIHDVFYSRHLWTVLNWRASNSSFAYLAIGSSFTTRVLRFIRRKETWLIVKEATAAVWATMPTPSGAMTETVEQSKLCRFLTREELKDEMFRERWFSILQLNYEEITSVFCSLVGIPMDSWHVSMSEISKWRAI
jgi:hypothetical protein